MYNCVLKTLRKIIVHGDPTATESLLESCANIRAMTKDIYAPTEGESVQIGQNTNSYSISLSDEMLASVRMSRVGFYVFLSLERSFIVHLSSKTTRSASSQGESRQPPARTFQFSSRPTRLYPLQQVAPPRHWCVCSVPDRHTA